MTLVRTARHGKPSKGVDICHALRTFVFCMAQNHGGRLGTRTLENLVGVRLVQLSTSRWRIGSTRPSLESCRSFGRHAGTSWKSRRRASTQGCGFDDCGVTQSPALESDFDCR